MIVFYKNFFYIQKFQKNANNKGVKSRSYNPVDKIQLSNKYIKIK